MINLDNYTMLDEPVITVFPGYRGKDMEFIAETNYVDAREIPWKTASLFAHKYGRALPAEFTGKVPDDAGTGDDLLYAPFDQATVDRILHDADRDGDMAAFHRLEEAKLALRREIFPQTRKPE